MSCDVVKSQDKYDGIEFLLSTALCADRLMLIFDLHNVWCSTLHVAVIGCRLVAIESTSKRAPPAADELEKWAVVAICAVSFVFM